jgi:hypothetical protein
MSDAPMPDDIPAEDPAGELDQEAWNIYVELWQTFWKLRNSDAAQERYQKFYEEEFKDADKVESLAEMAGMLWGGVSMIAEFTTAITLRAVAKYLAEHESFGQRSGSDD